METISVRFLVNAAGAAVSFLIQAGFGMLQVGGIQSSKSRHMLIKNVFDVSIAGLGWWLIGYGIAYGRDNKSTFIGGTNYVTENMDTYSEWISSFSLSIVSMAIISGSMAERIQLGAHVVSSLLFTAVLYPFIVHWAWGNGWASPFRSSLRQELLAGCGVLDFAGSGVIHMAGGIMALIMSKVVGPREGRFTVMFDYPMYANIFQSIGTLVIWFGWYGIIITCSQSVKSDDNWGIVIVRAMATTSVSAAASCITSVLLGHFINGHVSSQLGNSGALSGLVAVSAACATCSMGGAVVIGVVAGIVNYSSSILIGFIEVDDVIDAIPIHFFNGMWGLIAAGLFTKQEYYIEAYSDKYTHEDGSPFSRSHHCAGVFYGGDGNQLAANICYIFTIFAWCGALSFIALFVLDVSIGLKPTPEKGRPASASARDREMLMMP